MVRLNSKKMNLTYRAVLTLTPETHKGAGFNDPMKLVIADPIFLDFYVDRSVGSQVNIGVLKFYNLSRKTSSLINQTNYELLADAVGRDGEIKASRIELYAFYLGEEKNENNTIGYIEPIQLYMADEANAESEILIRRSGVEAGDLEENLIFKGIITEANTYRESGSTNIITEILADDRFIELGLVDSLIHAGQSVKDVVLQLAKDGGYKEINVGEFNGLLLNNWVVDKNRFTAINAITGGLAFMDCDVLNVLNNNEVLADRYAVIKLTSESGLLGTPRRTWGQLTGEIMFAPELRLAMKVRIESSIDARWDGEYKVLGLTHKGKIGPGASNYATTSITILAGPLAQAASTILTQAQPQTPRLGKYVKREKVMAAQVTGHSVYDVIAYIQKYRRAPADWYITSEITWANAIGENNCKSDQLPSPGELERLINVCRIVQGIKDQYYPAGRLRVESGWRSKAYNADLKGAVPNSAHLRGYALDFSITGYNQAKIVNFIRANFPGYAYHMKSYDKIHYDTLNRVGTKQLPVQGWSDP